MRELKFRAWSEETKSFEYFDLYEGTECGLANLQIWARRSQIEQYTGLKDKNDKEIYEGDIVRINGWWYAAGPAGYDENLCAVKWDEEITGFAPFNDYDCDCGVYHNAEDCEVIGNIHENPELVKEEE